MTSAAISPILLERWASSGGTGDITDGEDVGHVGATFSVDGDEPPGVRLDPRKRQGQRTGVWAHAHGHEDLVGRDGFGTARCGDPDVHCPRFAFVVALGLGAGVKGDASPFQGAVVGPEQVGSGSGQHGVEGFDDGDVGSELGVSATELQTDDAAADHHEAIRDLR